LCGFVGGVACAHSSGRDARPTSMEKSHLITGQFRCPATQAVRRLFSFLVLTIFVCGIGLMGVDASSASASCGDWLVHPVNSMDVTPADETSPASSSKSHVAERERSVRLPLSKPCRSLHCSKAPAAPAQPLPPTSVMGVDQVAFIANDNSYESISRNFRYGREADFHSSKGFPSRIEHPPRA
jgi:hypothetical protein